MTMPRRSAIGYWLAGIALLLPFLYLAAQILLAGLPDVPLKGDQSLIEIETRAVVQGEIPLVGPSSPFGVNHPGPALFLLMAPLYWVTGWSVSSLFLTAVLMNGLCLVGAAWLIRRAADATTAMIFVILGLVWIRFAAPHLCEISNPDVTIHPFILCMVALAAAACGDRYALAVAALAGTFCMQTRVLFVPILLGLALVAALLGRYLTGRPVPSGPGGWRLPRDMVPLAGLIVAGAAWLPPLAQQLLGARGNLGGILEYVWARPPGHDWTATLGMALPQVSQFTQSLLTLVSPLLEPATHLPSAFLPAVQVTLLIVCTIVAYRSRRRFLLALGILTTSLILILGIWLGNIVGPVSSELFQWITSIELLAWLVILVTAAKEIRPLLLRGRPDGRSKAWITLGTLAVVMLAVSAPAVRRESFDFLYPSAKVVALWSLDSPVLDPAAAHPEGPVVLRYVGSRQRGTFLGLVNLLSKRGDPIFVDRTAGLQFPPSYLVPTDPTAALVVMQRSFVPPAGDPGVLRLVGGMGNDEIYRASLDHTAEGEHLFSLLPTFAAAYDGFTGVGQAGNDPLRWSSGKESMLRLALQPGAWYRFTLDVMPFIEPGRQQDLDVEWNGKHVGQVRLQAARAWEPVYFNVRAAPTKPLNTLVFRYSYTALRRDAIVTGRLQYLAVAFRSLKIERLGKGSATPAAGPRSRRGLRSRLSEPG